MDLKQVARLEKSKKYGLQNFNYRGKKFIEHTRNNGEVYWESKEGDFYILLTDRLNGYNQKGIQYVEDETGDVITEVKL